MENITAKIEKNTRKVYLSKSVIGNDGENLQEKLVFSFDSFVNGTARLELNKNNTQSYIMLTKVDNTYELPIRSLITKVGKLDLQLVITEGTNENEIPIFKSNVFFVIVNPSINAEIEEEEDYPQWIDVANTKLNEIDEALDDLQDKVDSGYFKGDKGDKGDTGDTGPIGPIGPQGIQGERGLTGATGPQGERGEKGDTGSTGATGPAGPKGDTGERGPAGTNGQDGFSPIANVSQSGDVTTISITDKNGTTTADIDLSDVGGVEINKIPTNVYLDEMEKGVYYFNKDISSYVTIYTTQGASGNSFNNPLLLVIKEKYSSTMPNGTFAVLYYCDTYDYGIKYTAFHQRSNGVGRDNRVFGTVISTTTQTFTGKKIFSTIPEVSSYLAPTTNTQLAAKKYVDDSISTKVNTSSFVYDSQTETLTITIS